VLGSSSGTVEGGGGSSGLARLGCGRVPGSEASGVRHGRARSAVSGMVLGTVGGNWEAKSGLEPVVSVVTRKQSRGQSRRCQARWRW
jgi:hypothetical protein